MVDDEGSPIAPASPRRPAKDQSEINRAHRLSSALKKHYPLLEITQVTGTHAYTHDRITGKTARWTLSQQGSLSSIPVNASTIALERNQDCQPVAAGTRSSDLPSPLPPSPEKALVPRSWSLPRSNPPRPLFTSSTEDLPRANSLPTPMKLTFSDSGTLSLTLEEAQASSTGREGECPNLNPNDEQASPLPTPTTLTLGDSGALNLTPEEAQASSTGREGECPNSNNEQAISPSFPVKLPFSDSGALNPILEEAQASSTGWDQVCLNPSDEPMATEDPAMDSLTARLTSLELQPQIWQSGPTGDADPPGRSLDSPSEGGITEVKANPPESSGPTGDTDLRPREESRLL